MTRTAKAAGSMQDATLLRREILLARPKRFVREDLRMPDGYQCDWYYVDTPPSVLIVPVTADGTMIMVRQWRHNLKRHTLEFPAGAVDDGEPLKDAAARELEEETGHKLGPGGHLEKLGSFCSLPSETNKRTHMYIANGVIAGGPATGDAQIEKYFDMSIEHVARDGVPSRIGTSIIGTESITAYTLASQHLDSKAPPRSE